jgi:hypothetical protein
MNTSQNPFDDTHGGHSSVMSPGLPDFSKFQFQEPLKDEDPFSSTANLNNGGQIPLASTPPSMSNPGSHTGSPAPTKTRKLQRRMSTLICPYNSPSDMPPETLDVLSKLLGDTIDVRDLFARLDRTRLNAEAWMRGERGASHDPSSSDLSKSQIQYNSILEATPKKVSLGDKIQKFLTKVGSSGNPLAPGEEAHKSASYAGLSGRYGTGNGLGGNEGPSSIPPPPPHIHQDDVLQLAIYYHEQNDLKLSAYYFKKSADEKHPLGLFLYAMALRHGWGIDENQAMGKSAFVCCHQLTESEPLKKKNTNDYYS